MKYKWKTRPYKHQIEAVKKLISNGYGGALLMEPRTGKSKVTVDWLSILSQADKIDRVVIMCPSRVMDVWVEQFATHCPLNASVMVWDARARRTTPLPRPNAAHDLTVVVVNYNAFATPGKELESGRRSKKSGRFKHRQLLKKWVDESPSGAAVVLDESHAIKSPSGRAANLVVSMARYFNYRVILTGTPVTKANRVHDLYMQWKFLNPERLTSLGLYTSKDVQEFTGRWISVEGSVGSYVRWVGERSQGLETLRYAIHQDSYSITRDECYDLPEVLPDNVVPVVLNRETRRVYDELAREMVAEIEHQRRTHTVESSTNLVKALRLAQITGGVATTDENHKIRIGQDKLKALQEIVEDEAEKDQKLVIAARFVSDLNAIARLGRKLDLPVYELRGGVSREDGTRNIRKFQKGEGSALFVMHPHSGSLGIDLSAASHMIWYSLTTSYVHYSQACDRIALSGKANKYTYLIAPNTVDGLIYEAMQIDGDVARMMAQNPELLLKQR